MTSTWRCVSRKLNLINAQIDLGFSQHALLLKEKKCNNSYLQKKKCNYSSLVIITLRSTVITQRRMEVFHFVFSLRLRPSDCYYLCCYPHSITYNFGLPFPPDQCCSQKCARSTELVLPTLTGRAGKFSNTNCPRL